MDALRWDYLDRTRVMARLGREGIRGRLQEPFGFTPRTAYFRGRDVEDGGHTHMFEWRPDTSPFGAARHLTEAAAIDAGLEAHIRSVVTEYGRSRVTAFASRYLTTASIPLQALPYFDVAEVRADWEAPHEPDSLFAHLSAAGIRPVVHAWPDTNGRSDRSVVAAAINDIDASRRFAFVHLSGLDAAGHA